MANPDSDVTSATAEWIARSTRARALAGALEVKARSRLADGPYLLELARKLRVSASIFERRVLKTQMKDGKPSFQALSESPNDTLSSGDAPSF